MKKNDKIVSIILFVFSILLYIYSGTFPVRPNQPRVLNAGFYPQLLALILGGLAILHLIAAFKKDYEAKKEPIFWKNKSSFILFLKTLFMLVIYPFLLNYLGFGTATLIFITLMVYFLSNRESRSIKKMALISLAITAAIYLVFNEFINIPFPHGLMF